MRRNTILFIFTISGITTLFTLQIVWLYSTYTLIKNEIFIDCNNIIEEALNTEINIIAKELPKGTRIVGGPNNDSIPQVTYLYEGIYKLGYQLSLQRIDSIASHLLKARKIDEDFYIKQLNPKTNKTYQTSKEYSNNIFTTVKSRIIPTKVNYSQGIQLIVNNPQSYILKRISIILISTAIMVAFIIGCIIYQIKIVSRLNKIVQIREDFSYAMIHDMKTPLSTIFMTLNFLHSGRLDDKPEMKEKYYKIAESEADHLLTLTNKVLTISKLEKHKLEMAKEEVPLAPMIEKLTDKFTAKASKPIHFTVNLKATEAYADKEYLEEVISNLIDNAIKYSKETVEIQISSESNELYTILKVHDNGLGISKEDQSIIFNKYERAAATKRNRKGGAAGFGLGLNFVEQVITAHDGKVIVNSIEGEFTEFTIYLPQVMQKI